MTSTLRRAALGFLLSLALVGVASAQTSDLAVQGHRLFQLNPANNPNVSNDPFDDFIAALDDTSWGSVPTCVVDMTTIPTDADTLTIGADVYEFCSAANDDLANNTNIGVLVGANAAAAVDNLVAAINCTGEDEDRLHASLDNLDGTPADACGTENIMAREITQASCTECVQIRTASAEGELGILGFGVSASPSILLAQGLTPAASIWECGDVNLNTLGGRAPQPHGAAIQCKVMTAAMITNSVRWSFPFTVVNFIVTIRDTNGAIRMDGDLSTDLFTIDEGDVVGIFGGGAAPDTQATDVVCVVAWP